MEHSTKMEASRK
ncbi:hypothetical protein IEO21_10349 [Rhodonia placenta]|uniref:Uncharacterized protein n=1 Tax=Rhodonia placenta TaxID=104341 RepID=A0A8H7NRZ1_9APHY|nr:hypothetical protein IEO21_10710 [Postia placenta]KAF9798533.1 hypothetical protein IEO21_10698 [Postia placenta]KAF9800513.1 hypothetical protein IEO21_10349 [Postia placenta]